MGVGRGATGAGQSVVVAGVSPHHDPGWLRCLRPVPASRFHEPRTSKSGLPGSTRCCAASAGMRFCFCSTYFTQYAKVRISYRGDFFRLSLITSFAATVFGLAFVIVLFQKVPQLAGWRFEEVLFLYGFSLIPYGLFNVVSSNLYDFGNNYIIEGKFDRILLRPSSSLFQILFETFRIESLHEVAIAACSFAWPGRRSVCTRVWTPLENSHCFSFSRRCAGIILHFRVSDAHHWRSFWFEDRIGVHPPVWNVIAFGRYPLSIYSAAVQFFLCWIIPFGLASFYPSVRLLGRSVRPEYAPFCAGGAAVAFFCHGHRALEVGHAALLFDRLLAGTGGSRIALVLHDKKRGASSDCAAPSVNNLRPSRMASAISSTVWPGNSFNDLRRSSGFFEHFVASRSRPPSHRRCRSRSIRRAASATRAL